VILVIGYGNTLRSDDGLGWRVAQAVAGDNVPANVEVISCTQLTADLAEPVSRAARVLFIDTSREGKPGVVRCRRIGPEPGTFGFSHQLTPPRLLAVAQELHGCNPEGYVFSVPGECFDYGEELSPALKLCVPELLRRVNKLIAQPEAPKLGPNRSTAEPSVKCAD
jgi:hydrogenase maturation protease